LKSLLIFLVFFLLAGSTAAQTSTGNGNQVFRIGLFSSTISKINRNDATAALKAWGEAIVKERNIRVEASVKLYDGFEELRKDFVENRLDAISITAMDFPQLKVPVDFIFVISTNAGVNVRYALIVHRESGIETVGALRGRRVAIYRGQRMELANVWLESLLSEIGENAVGPNRPATAELENPSQAIFQVFFGQADAALVTRESFALAGEMNPQVGNQLTILAVSPPFIPTLFIFHPTFQGSLREQMESAILELDATPGGRQVLTVFQSNGFEKTPFSVLAETLEFLDDHNRIAESVAPTGDRP
jgi:hypothetical protein